MTTQNIIDAWDSGVEPYNATTRKDCDHNEMVELVGNPTWAWQCSKCGYIYGKHGTPKPKFPTS